MTNLSRSVEAARDAIGVTPAAAIVLGSGLGDFVAQLTGATSVSTAELPGFPASTVAGHAGRLWGGRLGEVPVCVLQGRVHGYEGYALAAVTHAVRVMRALGARTLCLTNAAGAMTRAFRPGDFMLVTDHVNLSAHPFGFLPELRELLPSRRFDYLRALPGDVYSPRLADCARAAASSLGIPLREGVLVYGRGPTYETRAEVSVYRTVGGHAACMSTVPEALVARLVGFEVMAISCISNLGTGLSTEKLRHADVTDIANRVAGPFRRLLAEVVRRSG